jgi:hypothetical protein
MCTLYLNADPIMCYYHLQPYKIYSIYAGIYLMSLMYLANNLCN